MTKRDQISNEFKWDLTSIYKTEEDWNKEYDYVLSKLSIFDEYKDTLMSSASTLYKFLKFDEEISRKIDKLYVYANMTSDSELSNTKSQTLLGRIKDLYTKYGEITSYVNPLLLKYDYSLIEQYMEEEPKLKSYNKILKEIYRYKPHILSDVEEKLISSLGNIFSNPEDTYSYLTDSDMKFGTIIDENNKEIELTESNYSIYIRSDDRRVRKDAFNRLYETYNSFKNTISSTMSGNVDYLTKIAKIKNFNSSIEASLFNEEIDLSVYNNLINTVNDNFKVLFDYYDIKKQILGLDELHLYDNYASLIKNSSKKYSFTEAKDLVLNAMSVLGKEYKNNLEKAFDEKWIDIYPNEAKRGGAYSGGCYDTKPFVLLNYEGLLEDVSTLAHELGHSMHSYLTRTNNPYQTGDYKIFVAEVASTVNELLLAKYMIKNSTNKEEKLTILNNLLDLYKATIYRQVMFAEFERDIHSKNEKGEVLTNELLCDLYYNLNKKYFGSNVVVDELIKNEWMRVPHFYYNFYVYKYAIGLSCASRIVDNILSGKEGSIDKYIKFLSSGSSKSPMELLKDTDCDLTSSEVIESAIKMFSELLDEFIETYNEVEEGKQNGQKRLLRGSWR